MAKWLDKYEQGGLVLKKKTKDNYGKRENPNDIKASVGPDFVGLGYNTKGRDYSPAWGGQFQDGGKLTLPEAIVYGHKDAKVKDYFDKVRTDAEKWKDEYYWNTPTAGYHALEQMHNKYGAPKINTIGEKDRAYYNPITDSINISIPKFGDEYGDPVEDQFLHELAHKVQANKKGNVGFVKDFVGKDLINTLKNVDSSDIFTKKGWLDAYRKNYHTPGTVENEAHSVIAPKLEEEYRDIRSKQYDRLYGDMAMGGSLPGAVGFTYARTAGSAPANGKYTKKTKASAQNGKEMSFYQNGLDFKPKSISKNGSVIKDDRGQWAHPGEVTEIGSSDITMQGVDYPVLGVSDTGDTKMMYPDQDYKFDGNKVTEFPMAQDGGWLDKYQDGGNINKKLKEEAEERLARMNTPKATISQYTPEPGEQAKFDKQKLKRIAEDNALLNRMAASKGAANMQDAIETAMTMEGGIAAGKFIGKGAKALVKQLPNAAKYTAGSMYKTYNENIYPILNKEKLAPYADKIAKLNEMNAATKESLKSGELRKRLINQGLTEEEVSNMKVPNLAFFADNKSPGTSYSRYQDINNSRKLEGININFDQLDRLKNRLALTPEAAYEHEVGHFLQRPLANKNPLNDLNKYNESLKNYKKDLRIYKKEGEKLANDYGLDKNKVIKDNEKDRSHLLARAIREKDEAAVNWFDRKPQLPERPNYESELDKKVRDLNFNNENSFSNYFNKDHEAYPFLREMRQTMVDEGFIKDKYQDINKDAISNFLNSKTKNRLKEALSHKEKESNTDILHTLLKTLPAVAPAVVASQSQEKKNGGWLNKYK